MSNITLLLNEKCFLFPNSINATDSQKELINNIFQKHEGGTILKIEPIDENDFFDSFLITTDKNLFCLKISLSMDEIFYDFLILNGIQSLNISPRAVTRGQIQFGKEIFYTIQTYEELNNLYSISNYELINNKDIFSKTLNSLNSIQVPNEVQKYLNTLQKITQRNNKNFQLLVNSILNKNNILLKMEEIYNNIFIKLQELLISNMDIINLNKLNHGNLNHETILTNEFEIKYINFENSFLGNDYFDIINLIFELQIVGIQEHSFLNKNLPEKMKENSEKLIFNYKISKNIWSYKKLLDIIYNFCKQFLLNRDNKNFNNVNNINNFSKHFYRFSDINEFSKNKDFLVENFLSYLPK